MTERWSPISLLDRPLIMRLIRPVNSLLVPQTRGETIALTHPKDCLITADFTLILLHLFHSIKAVFT